MDIHFFLPIAYYTKFILNQYQEGGQKPSHSAMPKNSFIDSDKASYSDKKSKSIF